MKITKAIVQSRATQVKSALKRADINHDGVLNSREQSRARGMVSGASGGALLQAMAQGRLGLGRVSVGRASARVNTALQSAFRSDRNHDGVISASERKIAGGPIAQALTQGATGSSGGGSVSAPAGRGKITIPASLRAYGNGKIPTSKLESVGIGGHKLYGPAARAFKAMKSAAANAGHHLTITDSYRSYAQQVDLARRKGLYSQGGLAATPGKSNHGWGIAIDANVNNRATLNWLRQNAARFGFHENVPREPWHWEYSVEFM